MLSIIFDFIEINDHTHSMYYVINFDSTSACAGSYRYLQDQYFNLPCILRAIFIWKNYLCLCELFL